MRGDEGQALRVRLDELARRAGERWQSVCSRFLAQEERELARRCAGENGVEAAFDGGWEGAERVQCCFFPADGEPAFTGRWLRVAWNPRFGTVDHRALLGSLMSLGMEREMLGDLVIQEGCAYVRAMPELAQRLPMELSRVGGTTVTVQPLEEAPALTPPKGTELRDTVASLRLDSVLASGLRASRSRAAEWIRQGLVQVNHQPTERTDYLLKAGDLLSVRGFGRVRLQEAGAPTRKDRIPILLEVFSKK